MQNEVSKATVSKSGKVRKNYIPATLQRTSLLITLPGTNFKVNSRRLGKFFARPIVPCPPIPNCQGFALGAGEEGRSELGCRFLWLQHGVWGCQGRMWELQRRLRVHSGGSGCPPGPLSPGEQQDQRLNKPDRVTETGQVQ